MGTLTDEIKRVVTEMQLCYAATVSPDGKPNLSEAEVKRFWLERYGYRSADKQETPHD
jgi:predicted pyridoxine 5'-phosphate oxidase superfamily flavin-nucleotide-binding protein